MKKLILIGIGLAGAGAFVGFDAVEALFDQTRADVRSKLMSPEVELQAQIADAQVLSDRCGESIVNGQMALARLDSMIDGRTREIARRGRSLERDRAVLERRQRLLSEERSTYLIGREEVSRRTLNRDAVLRAKAYATDREILEHVDATIAELRMQRESTAGEIEEASHEIRRLGEEVTLLKAELENLKARRAVAQTREEARYIFDRSTFDKAREKISEIRANIAQQNRRLDYFSRRPSTRKGLIPAETVPEEEEDGAEAIASVLGEEAPRSDAAYTSNR